MMGFGAHSRVIHTFKIERLSEDLPIVIEIIDGQDKIEDFLTHAEGRIKRGMLATVEKVQVRVYRGGEIDK
jgi:PII-like signaling protein